MDDCANAQYSPITEAIRSRVESGWDPWPEAREWLLGKCDTIDAIHAELERENERLRKKVKHQGAQLTEVQDALERRNEGELKPRWQKELNRLKAEHANMAAALDCAEGEHDYAPESHYVMLPKDADGVPIHVGDVLVHVNNLNISTKPFEVRSLVWHGDSWTVCDRIGPTVKHSVLRHHGPDTWERIIEDAIGLGECYHSDVDMARLVARCKALAGDGTGECNEHH